MFISNKNFPYLKTVFKNMNNYYFLKKTKNQLREIDQRRGIKLVHHLTLQDMEVKVKVMI